MYQVESIVELASGYQMASKQHASEVIGLAIWLVDIWLEACLVETDWKQTWLVETWLVGTWLVTKWLVASAPVASGLVANELVASATGPKLWGSLRLLRLSYSTSCNCTQSAPAKLITRHFRRYASSEYLTIGQVSLPCHLAKNRYTLSIKC